MSLVPGGVLPLATAPDAGVKAWQASWSLGEQVRLAQCWPLVSDVLWRHTLTLSYTWHANIFMLEGHHLGKDAVVVVSLCGGVANRWSE